MIRPFVGLVVTCFLVGCGTSTPPETTATSGGAVEEVADTTTEKKMAEATTSTHMVAFKVPGMT